MGTILGRGGSIFSLGVALDFGLDFAFVAGVAFFGAAFLAAAFVLVFFTAVDALFDAATGSWIRRVVKNVRRVAANADEVKADEDETLIRNTGRLDTVRRAKSENILKIIG